MPAERLPKDMQERGGVYPTLPELPPEAVIVTTKRMAPSMGVFNISFSCSACNREFKEPEPEYCPHCGKKFG